MSIRFPTSTPNKLLKTYKEAIDQGHVDTWEYNDQGYFTHTPSQWYRRAWLKPSVVEKERLVFNIIRPQGSSVPTDIYAVYHGRFIESMINHCADLFTEARATPTPDSGDLV